MLLSCPSLDRNSVSVSPESTPTGVTNVAWEAYNDGDDARPPPSAPPARRRCGGVAGRYVGALGAAGIEAAARRVRLVRAAARLREGADEAVRRALRLRRRRDHHRHG